MSSLLVGCLSGDAKEQEHQTQGCEREPLCIAPPGPQDEYPMSPSPELEMGKASIHRAVVAETFLSTIIRCPNADVKFDTTTEEAHGNTAQFVRKTWQRWGRGNSNYGILGAPCFRQGLAPIPAQNTTLCAGTPTAPLTDCKHIGSEVLTLDTMGTDTDNADESSTEDFYNMVCPDDTEVPMTTGSFWEDIFDLTKAGKETEDLDAMISDVLSTYLQSDITEFEEQQYGGSAEPVPDGYRCEEYAPVLCSPSLESLLKSSESIPRRVNDASWVTSIDMVDAPPTVDPKDLFCLPFVTDPFDPDANSTNLSAEAPCLRSSQICDTEQVPEMPTNVGRKTTQQKSVQFGSSIGLTFINEPYSHASTSNRTRASDLITPPPEVDLNEQLMYVPPQGLTGEGHYQDTPQWSRPKTV